MTSVGPDLNFTNVVLSFLPIGALLVTILAFKWGAPRAGAMSWLIAVVVALIFFGADAKLVGIASSKGLSLSLFVLMIIWTSVFLYNVIDQLGGIEVIGNTMTRLVKDPLGQALIVGWAFSGFMQGVAGFGVPVAVVAPLLVLMRFSPAKAAAIVLVGHAWAVTFGSLGSSYYTIQLVTEIDGAIIGPHMAAVFAFPIVLTGFAVAHLQGGMVALRRGAVAILIMGVCMAAALWVVVFFGAPQIASIVSGLVGCGAGWILINYGIMGKSVGNTSANIEKGSVEGSNPKSSNFHVAFLPYYLVVGFSIMSQIPVIKEFGTNLVWGLDYPATHTQLGYEVDAQADYARIRLMGHPAPLILLSLAISHIFFRVGSHWRSGAGMTALKNTYSQCVPTSVGVGTMVMMALVMTDTGMTVLLGKAIANGTGVVFPIFSPYIGVLGTFMTGSNTNSNIMFGALQLETANAIGIGTVTVASIQSIGGSLGSAIAPAKVLVGTAIVGLSGREGEVMRQTIPYCLIIVLLTGLLAWVIVYMFGAI